MLSEALFMSFIIYKTCEVKILFSTRYTIGILEMLWENKVNECNDDNWVTLIPGFAMTYFHFNNSNTQSDLLMIMFFRMIWNV